jgi:Cu+-exporting ATPase
MTKKITLKITGMHCTSCAMNIDGELEDLGVNSANTNYARAITEVEFDSDKIKLEKIQEVIKELGYTVSAIL